MIVNCHHDGILTVCKHGRLRWPVWCAGLGINADLGHVRLSNALHGSSRNRTPIGTVHEHPTPGHGPLLEKSMVLYGCLTHIEGCYYVLGKPSLYGSYRAHAPASGLLDPRSPPEFPCWSEHKNMDTMHEQSSETSNSKRFSLAINVRAARAVMFVP